MGGAIPGLHASPGPGGVPPTSGSGPPLCAAGPALSADDVFLAELD
jgi:hypothetical protein